MRACNADGEYGRGDPREESGEGGGEERKAERKEAAEEVKEDMVEEEEERARGWQKGEEGEAVRAKASDRFERWRHSSS